MMQMMWNDMFKRNHGLRKDAVDGLLFSFRRLIDSAVSLCFFYPPLQLGSMPPRGARNHRQDRPRRAKPASPAQAEGEPGGAEEADRRQQAPPAALQAEGAAEAGHAQEEGVVGQGTADSNQSNYFNQFR